MKENAKKGLSAARREMLSLAQLLGEEPLPPRPKTGPGAAAFRKPMIDIKQTYSALAEAVAGCLPPRGLYRSPHGGFFTIVPRADSPAGYESRAMDALRFATWCERWMAFGSPRKGAAGEVDYAPTSLSEAQARLVMQADVFRERVPEVKLVSPLVLPLAERRAEGGWKFRVPKAGYDAATKIFFVDTLPLDWGRFERVPLAAIRALLERLFMSFPLDGGDVPAMKSRSLGACVTALLGAFLHLNIRRSPILIINANQRGTGKTFLARTLFAPVYGSIAAANYVEDDNEFRKTLNSLLLSGEQYCFLDDLKTLVSNTLNRFVTSDVITDRVMGTNTLFMAENRLQFVVTGNQLKSSTDVARRSLCIDLFLSEDALARTFDGSGLSEDVIVRPGWRGEMLGACWQLCRLWEAAGCPRVIARALPSFPDYSELAMNIAVWAGFADPTGPALLSMDAGDVMGETLVDVLVDFVTRIVPDDWSAPHAGSVTAATVQELVDFARDTNRLDIIVGAARNVNIAFGCAMRRLKGREFADSRGRKFRVGSKKEKASTRYEFRILTEPTKNPDGSPLGE